MAVLDPKQLQEASSASDGPATPLTVEEWRARNNVTDAVERASPTSNG